MNTQDGVGEYVSAMGTLVDQYPRMKIKRATMKLLNRYRATEPGLVNSAKEDTPVEVFVLEYDDEPLGVTSFFIQTNPFRKKHENLYARIDLVIVPKHHRGFGVARALVLCVLVYLIKVYKDRLYSISCLAAHKAIEKILQDLQFNAKAAEEKNFVQEELGVTRSSCERILLRFNHEADLALKAVNYRFRQEQSKAAAKN